MPVSNCCYISWRIVWSLENSSSGIACSPQLRRPGGGLGVLVCVWCDGSVCGGEVRALEGAPYL
jgi:hypothetical protein